MDNSELTEEDLSCPICFEDYLLTENRLPKLLLCLHTFCYSCLQHLLQFDGTLQCSICRTVHHVGRVCDLLDNDAIFYQLKLKQEQSDREYARRVELQEDSESESSSYEEPQEPITSWTLPVQSTQVPVQSLIELDDEYDGDDDDGEEEDDEEEESVLNPSNYNDSVEAIDRATSRGDYMEALRLGVIRLSVILSDRLDRERESSDGEEQQEVTQQQQVQSSNQQHVQSSSNQQQVQSSSNQQQVQSSSHQQQQPQTSEQYWDSYPHMASHPVQQQEHVNSYPVQHQQAQQQQQNQPQQQHQWQQNAHEADRDKRKVFVGGLCWNISWNEVNDFFNKFGPVQDIQLRRGFAFISFYHAATVEKVLGRHEFDCRCIEVRRYIPKTLKLFVGNTFGLNIRDVTHWFKDFGVVREVDAPSRNFCFVTFEEESAVCRALQVCHNIQGRRLRVERFNPNLWNSFD